MQPTYRPLSTIQRALLLGLGTTTLGIGIAGIFVPGLPSTVFLLITAGCYARSSERMYRWLLTRPWLQEPMAAVTRFEQHRSVPLRVKIIAQAFAWGSVVILLLTGARPGFVIFAALFALACSIFMAWAKTDRHAH